MHGIDNGTKPATITISFDVAKHAIVGVAVDGFPEGVPLPFLKAVLDIASDDLDAQIRFQRVAMYQAKMQEQAQAEMVRSALQRQDAFHVKR